MSLFRENAGLQLELWACRKLIQEYDAKLATLGQPSVYAIPMLEKQLGSAGKEVAALVLEVSGITSKLEALEQAVQTYRPKVDAFKAGHHN